MPGSAAGGPISALPAIPTWCRPAPAEAWSFEPFAASLRDGVLCGRGAVDMKGAIAAFIAAAERFLAARGDGFAGSISLLITGDEEGVAVNGTRKVLEWLQAARRGARRLRRRRADLGRGARRHDQDRPARQHDRPADRRRACRAMSPTRIWPTTRRTGWSRCCTR